MHSSSRHLLTRVLLALMVGSLALGAAGCRKSPNSTTLDEDLKSSMPRSEVMRRQEAREEAQIRAAEKAAETQRDTSTRQLKVAKQTYERARTRLKEFADIEYRQAQALADDDPQRGIRSSCLLWIADFKSPPNPPTSECLDEDNRSSCSTESMNAQIVFYEAALDEVARVEKELKRCPAEANREIEAQAKLIKELEAKFERERAGSRALPAASR